MFRRSWRRTLLGGRSGLEDDRDPLDGALGRLEREVMDVVWSGDGISVRDVQAKLTRGVAYTTVMTTLDRLFKKGLLYRSRNGRAFRYRAALTRQDAETALASGLLRGLLDGGVGGARPLLSNLVDLIGERDQTLLDELEALVRAKRKQSRQP